MRALAGNEGASEKPSIKRMKNMETPARCEREHINKALQEGKQ